MDIDNNSKNSRQVTHEYAIRNLVFLDMTGIYRKLNYSKQGPYRIIKSIYKWYSSSPAGKSKQTHK